MVEGQHSGAFRYAISISVAVATLAVLGFGMITLLPHAPDSSVSGIRSLKDLSIAYNRVKAGATRASALARLGFDSTTPNAEVLSYLGVMERFATADTTKFDKLDEALQNCIEARDRCTALVFKAGDQPRHAAAGMFSMLGFGSATAASGAPEVTLLVQNGRVAFKMITGVPQLAAAPARPRTVVAPVHSAALDPVAVTPVAY